MEDAAPIGYQLPQELVSLREQVRRIIHDEVLPAESRVDPDAAEILDDDYWAIAKKNAGRWNVVHGFASAIWRWWTRHV
jgi:hypothetical protein